MFLRAFLVNPSAYGLERVSAGYLLGSYWVPSRYMMQGGGDRGEASLPEVFIFQSSLFTSLIPGIIGISVLFVGHFHHFLGCERTNSAPHCQLTPFLVTIGADPSQGCRIKQGSATHMCPWCIFRSWEGLNQPLRSLVWPLGKERKVRYNGYHFTGYFMMSTISTIATIATIICMQFIKSCSDHSFLGAFIEIRSILRSYLLGR